jgi:hypothetical protein
MRSVRNLYGHKRNGIQATNIYNFFEIFLFPEIFFQEIVEQFSIIFYKYLF